jgi:hypothetical protein
MRKLQEALERLKEANQRQAEAVAKLKANVVLLTEAVAKLRSAIGKFKTGPVTPAIMENPPNVIVSITTTSESEKLN